MTETAEEREMQTAKFVAEASKNWKIDVERYQAIAEKLGITWLEALTLQMASCLKGMVDEMLWINQMLQDFHKERFPERWNSRE